MKWNTQQKVGLLMVIISLALAAPIAVHAYHLHQLMQYTQTLCGMLVDQQPYEHEEDTAGDWLFEVHYLDGAAEAFLAPGPLPGGTGKLYTFWLEQDSQRVAFAAPCGAQQWMSLAMK